MVLYVSESEMIERFLDSLKESSSRCRELVKSELSQRPQIFVDLIAALKVGAGSAHQLSMAQMNPRWLMFRDTLEKFAEFCQSNVFKDSESLVWFSVADKLEELRLTGRKMAEARALTRKQVLDELDIREKAAEVN